MKSMYVVPAWPVHANGDSDRSTEFKDFTLSKACHKLKLPIDLVLLKKGDKNVSVIRQPTDLPASWI